jgi:hypothetical protein
LFGSVIAYRDSIPFVVVMSFSVTPLQGCLEQTKSVLYNFRLELFATMDSG